MNRTDCGVLRAKPFLVRFFYGLRKPRNPTLGNEFAGQIESVGAGVTTFKAGDNVFGYNDLTFGAHAEHLVMPEAGMLTLMPTGMTYEEAAPTAEGAHYALKDMRRAKVTRGQRVLINGATGAIGSAAVQLAKYYGAEVTAVCSARHVELARSLGADTVLDYSKDDFTKRDETYDLVYDAVGKSSYGACRKLLKPDGIYCSSELGFLGQNPLLALWTSKVGRRRVIFVMPKARKEDMALPRELIETGVFKPVIDRRYPMEEIVDAFRYVETGHKTGNVVIQVQQNGGA